MRNYKFTGYIMLTNSISCPITHCFFSAGAKTNLPQKSAVSSSPSIVTLSKNDVMAKLNGNLELVRYLRIIRITQDDS